jgi:GAF domain-containing protein
MVGGTGAAGRRMLAEGHRLPIGKGLIGRAADTNAVVLVPDVGGDPDWLANDLLPETRGEIAVPISLGSRVLGVLDVQHNVAGRLSLEDASLLQSIANQTAGALQNARLYEQVRARAAQETIINAIGQRIQQSPTVDSALQIAVRELGRAARAPQATVRLEPAGRSVPPPGSQD